MNQYQQECIKDMKAWPKTTNSPTYNCKPVNICTVSAVPCAPPQWVGYAEECKLKQEGINPMRYNDNYASASATVQAPKSDAAVQRDYLISQLNNARGAKRGEFEKLFNLYVDNTPKTYKDMIDAITGGKYTIDPKTAKRIENWDTEENGNPHFGPLAGIIWEGPKSDFEGYQAALIEAEKQKTAAERIIITGDAAAGLKALQDFEAWVPTTATTAQ